MEKQEIQAVTIGWGESETYWAVGRNSVTAITQGLKPIEWSDGGISKELLVYNVFTGERLLIEVESNNNLHIEFKQNKT